MLDSLVTTEWLDNNLNDPNLVVLDCSVAYDPERSIGMQSVTGRANHDIGHIPTADFADLTTELRDPESSLEFGLPSVERFCEVMGELGVGDDSTVVLYDGAGSMWAARVWWMLRWAGFDRASLLDGGLSAWIAEGRPLSTEPAARRPKHLTPSPRPNLIADRDEVLASLDGGQACLIDTMPEAHFQGEMNLYGRPGHIPGADNVFMLSLLNETGHFRLREELEAMHKGNRAARTITYCGGGIAASGSAFVMTQLGFTDIAVYMASLQEWAADPSNPLVVGDAR